MWCHWHLCVCQYAFIWLELQNTFWVQWGVKVNEKFSNLFSRYQEGGCTLCIKDKYKLHV